MFSTLQGAGMVILKCTVTQGFKTLGWSPMKQPRVMHIILCNYMHFPGGGNGYPLQYSCLGNPMDRGACQATVHGVAKSQTRLSRVMLGRTSNCQLWHSIPLEKELCCKNFNFVHSKKGDTVQIIFSFFTQSSGFTFHSWWANFSR